MEHQTINAYGNKYAKAAEGYDWLLHHELAHEWFGNQMTNADWDDMWLHEGFGSYMQPLYLKYLHGDGMYYALLHRTRAGIRSRVPLVSGETRLEGEVYNDQRGGPGGDIYSKGSYVLHTLRNLIGDEAFFESVQRLVYGTGDPCPGNFAPRYSSSGEFARIVNEVTGRDYGWFFDAYVFSGPLPDLQITRDATGLDLVWKTANDAPFPMPVDVRIGDRVETLAMTNGRGHVAIPDGATYTIDPGSKILRYQPHIEVYQKYEARNRRERR
jgi:aminopeptidase N